MVSDSGSDHNRSSIPPAAAGPLTVIGPHALAAAGESAGVGGGTDLGLLSILRRRYRVVLGGQATQLEDTSSSLMFALVVGILVAYMVLASQFNSFLHPATVLSILPLSIAGAAFALLLSGKTLNVFSMIGVLLLMGIVKKNSIILVDYALIVREEGCSAVEAMLRAGPVRLRPILMTSIATLMGAVPAALEIGSGSETRSPMAIAVIGGLLFSTLLSLLVVPAFYVVADGLKRKLFKDKPKDAAPTAH